MRTDKTLKYTLDEIMSAWHECYGENLSEQYAGFLTYLINMRTDDEN
jgi:hypothetical protein